MMRPTARTIKAAAFLAAATWLLAGCAGFGPTGQERADQLVTQLESDNLGIREATADYTGSISSTMVLRVTLDDSVVEYGSVSSDTLRPIIATIGRGTEQMRLGSMDLYAKDSEGQAVSLASAAGDLGLTDAVDGKSLTLLQSDLRAIRKW